jgi:hypothetical protein
LSIIFGVVPEDTRAWNPEIAPHMMVMKTNGNTFPGTMGPPPATNSVTGGICRAGLAAMVPTTSAATVPILRKLER